jgi:hypothetical protein
MVGHPGSGDRPEVDAEVVAIGAVGAAERPERALGKRHQFDRGLLVERLELGGVLVGSDHEMTVRIRKSVQHHEAALPPVRDQGLGVVAKLRLRAEDALTRPAGDPPAGLTAGGRLYVFETPGGPQSLVRQCALILKVARHPTAFPRLVTSDRGVVGDRIANPFGWCV